MHVDSILGVPAPPAAVVKEGLVDPATTSGVSIVFQPAGVGQSQSVKFESSQLSGETSVAAGSQASDAPAVSVQQGAPAGAPAPGFVLAAASGTSEMVTTGQPALQQVGISYSSSAGMVTVSGQAPLGASILVTSVYTGPVLKSLDPMGAVTPLSPESMFSASTNTIPRLWLDASKRRSRSQIYIEIVELLTRGPMTPFEIAFYARLNHKRTKAYLEFLKSSGYVEVVDEDGRTTYVLTSGGREFVDRVRSLFRVDRSRAALRRSEYG